ncbi:androgen-induced gene 1 protein-like isoform X2 [Amphiura filiformis]|uniref:androgen-induced gene 1 protein-like isoform X2 n=1 Tax=Amphiura filiformis TaxID=82378 RepID=UPI003B214CFD
MAWRLPLVFCTFVHFAFLIFNLWIYYYYKFVFMPKLINKFIEEAKSRGITSPPSDQAAGDSAFLTIWNLIFQTFYFFWCCVTDLVLTSGSRSPIAKKFVAFRDWFLAAVAFPIGTLVVSMFWAIWAVDRELVFPKELDEFFPPWLNHVLHTTVLPILLIEMFLVQHKLPSRKVGVMGTLFVGLSYLLWVLYLGYAMDIWVYPVLKVLSGFYFGLFLTVSAFFLLGLYIVGEKISEFCWRGYPDSDYEFTKID